MAILDIRKKKHIFWAEVNRPESRNAIDFEVMDQLEKVLDDVEKNGTTRVFILSGAGDQYFVTRGNIKAFSSLKTEEEGKNMARRMTGILERLEDNHFWTMACVNGEVYGGGCEVILAFDFTIASKTAAFAFTQARFGLPPGWGGVTRLVERVGRSRALEWLGSNEVISSEDALNSNFINKIAISSELRRSTWEWALELARMEPDLIRELKTGTKKALYLPREESLQRELDAFARFWSTNQHHEKVADFLKKKKP